MRPTPTTVELDCCLRLLREADEPMLAAQIAERLGLSGSRETKRRKVRHLVGLLREKGVRIVANVNEGYKIARDSQEWLEYNEKRQIEAKEVLGESHRRNRYERTQGQGLLFGIK